MRRQLKASLWHLKTMVQWCEDIQDGEEVAIIAAHLANLDNMLSTYTDELLNIVGVIAEQEEGRLEPSPEHREIYEDYLVKISNRLNDALTEKCKELGVPIGPSSGSAWLN